MKSRQLHIAMSDVDALILYEEAARRAGVLVDAAVRTTADRDLVEPVQAVGMGLIAIVPVARVDTVRRAQAGDFSRLDPEKLECIHVLRPPAISQRVARLQYFPRRYADGEWVAKSPEFVTFADGFYRWVKRWATHIDYFTYLAPGAADRVRSGEWSMPTV